MNGSLESIKSIVGNLKEAKLDQKAEIVIAPPFPYLHWAVQLLKDCQTPIGVAAQNTYVKGSGAYTGEVSVDQIKDVGATWVIVGHSERRTIIKEDDEFIAEKTKFAISCGVSVILCIGETLEERNANKTIDVVKTQIDAVVAKLDAKDWDKVVIAYEPVWAIGTGLAATPDDAQEVHAAIRAHVAEKVSKDAADNVRIIYGGSVNGKNASTFNDKPDIDGYLVGGASLKPEFVDIVNSRS